MREPRPPCASYAWSAGLEERQGGEMEQIRRVREPRPHASQEDVPAVARRSAADGLTVLAVLLILKVSTSVAIGGGTR